MSKANVIIISEQHMNKLNMIALSRDMPVETVILEMLDGYIDDFEVIDTTKEPEKPTEHLQTPHGEGDK